MFKFEENLESAFAACTPFDESPLRNSEEYQQISRSLLAARQFLDRHAPGTMADVDTYLDTYLDLVDLECRHYFAEGYRLGRESVS